MGKVKPVFRGATIGNRKVAYEKAAAACGVSRTSNVLCTEQPQQVKLMIFGGPDHRVYSQGVSRVLEVTGGLGGAS